MMKYLEWGQFYCCHERKAATGIKKKYIRDKIISGYKTAAKALNVNTRRSSRQPPPPAHRLRAEGCRAQGAAQVCM